MDSPLGVTRKLFRTRSFPRFAQSRGMHSHVGGRSFAAARQNLRVSVNERCDLNDFVCRTSILKVKSGGGVQRQQANRSVLIGEDHQQLHTKENSLQQPSDLDKNITIDQPTFGLDDSESLDST